ncbi:PilZ domain-containing protein [Thiorhodococcus fuscus]|uniref:PilZ domain-containing protein n=1 Tax=Thiorhodococcus fuscus TaxID=527200 RepID=A0ABW4YA56_9GAMM
MLLDDERRDFMRLVAETEVSITRLTSGQVIAAKLINLSASGCAFYTDKILDPGEELEILVRSPSERIDPLRRPARVARVSQGESQHMVGVEFLNDLN